MRAELLAPAGSYEAMTAAYHAGADAVYIGGEKFGARAYADNPDSAHMLEAIDYAHLHGKQLYLTVNTMLKERELENELYDYLLPFYRRGLDAVIVQDFGVFAFIKKRIPRATHTLQHPDDNHRSGWRKASGTAGRGPYCDGKGTVTAGDTGHQEPHKARDREFCSRCTVLLLFRSVPVQQHAGRTQRKPGKMRTALPSAVSGI